MIIIPFLALLLPTHALFNVISFAKQLYIPGQYFSLMNFSKNTQPLQNYYDVQIDFNLTQAMYQDQGNSIFDFFLFEKSQYNKMEPCYYETVVYLNNLYSEFQPCQGGCNSFQAVSQFSINKTYLEFSGEQYDNISLIMDNTFFPCNGGAYQSEIYLYQVINLTIESNASYLFVIKVVFVVLLQLFIFLFAYIVIMLQKLQNKKKRLKKVKQEQEDQQVLYSLQRDRENQ